MTVKLLFTAIAIFGNFFVLKLEKKIEIFCTKACKTPRFMIQYFLVGSTASFKIKCLYFHYEAYIFILTQILPLSNPLFFNLLQGSGLFELMSVH